MMPKLLPCLFVATCALANAIDGQATPSVPCLDYAPTNSVDWPATGYGSGSDFRRLVAGNLEGSEDVDGRDVVALAGSTLVYMPRLHYQTAMFALDWAPVTHAVIEDIAVLPDGIAPGQDGLLVSDEDGLHLVELEGGTAFTATTLAAGNPWDSVTRLQAVDLDADGACEVLALAADGATVLVLHGALGTSPTTSSFSTVGAVIDLEAFEWITTLGGLELAVLRTDGLQVYTASGTFLRSFPHASTRGQVARVRTPEAVDLLAWSRLVPAGTTTELVTVRMIAVSQGVRTEFDLCTSTLDVDPATLTGADYDGDGLDDLLLTYEQHETAIVMLNQGAFPWFTPADTDNYDVIQLVPSYPALGTGNDSIPFFGDLDGNARADFVHGVSKTQTVEVLTNAAYVRQLDEDNLITADDIARLESEIHPDLTLDAVHLGYLNFAFNVPDDFSARTHLEVVLLEQGSPANNPVSETAVYHYVFGLNVGATLPQYVVLDGLKENEYWADHKHYYMRYRFADADGINPIVLTDASPWFVGGWTLRPQSSEFPSVNDMAGYYMMSHGGIAGTAFGLSVLNGITTEPGDQSTTLGAYVPMSRVPPFQPGAVPVVGPAVSAGTAQTFTPPQ